LKDIGLPLVVQTRLAHCLSVISKLKLPDALRERAKDAQELADELNLKSPELLEKILRLLASHGILSENSSARFGLTDLSLPLVSDHPSRSRDFFCLFLGELHSKVYSNLRPSLINGENPFHFTFQADNWEYFETHPEEGAEFNRMMQESVLQSIQPLSSDYPYSQFRNIMDVGCGLGSFLFAILDKNPNAKGILFDRPQVIQEVRVPDSLQDRVQMEGGNFLEKVPSMGEDSLILMKFVSHNWDDDKVGILLKNCFDALSGKNSRLVIIELLVPEYGANDLSSKFIQAFDLDMLAFCNGRERKRSDFERILKKAGFVLTRIIPSSFTFPARYHFIEAMKPQ
jgi:SAM-dependent methyltransferase